MNKLSKQSRELDALIAEKVFGIRYEVFEADEYLTIQSLTPGQPKRCPMYSADIAAAWQVVEKLKELSEFPTADLWIEFCDWLSIAKDGFNLNFWDVSPRSICFAALEAVSKKSRSDD